jgi:hypothetical protein
MQHFPEGDFAPGELACVGAGIGGGFVNTKELHVMKKDQAIDGGPKKEQWNQAVEKNTEPWLHMKFSRLFQRMKHQQEQKSKLNMGHEEESKQSASSKTRCNRSMENTAAKMTSLHQSQPGQQFMSF